MPRMAAEGGYSAGLLLDEFGGDFHGGAGLCKHHGAEHGDGSGFAGHPFERIVGHVSQLRVPVANIDPDAVLRDQVLGVGEGEEIQVTGVGLLITLNRVNYPVQRRAGQFLGADADHAVHGFFHLNGKSSGGKNRCRMFATLTMSRSAGKTSTASRSPRPHSRLRRISSSHVT